MWGWFPVIELFLTLLHQSGDSPLIPLVEANDPPTEVKDRWKVVEKMEMVTQYTFAGDYTGMCGLSMVLHNIFANICPPILVEAIDKAVTDVAKFDAGKYRSLLCALHQLNTAP